MQERDNLHKIETYLSDDLVQRKRLLDKDRSSGDESF